MSQHPDPYAAPQPDDSPFNEAETRMYPQQPHGDQAPQQQYGQPPYGGQAPQQYGQPPYGGQAPQQYGQPPYDGQAPQQYGQPPYDGQAPQQYGHPTAYPPYGANPYAPQETRRPGTVTAGCVLAWIGSAAGILMGLVILAVSGDPESLGDLGLGSDVPGGVVAGVGIFYAVWCIAVVILAVFAFRGARGAAITLLVMGVLMALMVLYGVINGTPTGLIGMAWILLSANLIAMSSSSRDWYAARSPRLPGYSS